jgi:hypothetical protein
MIVMRIWPGLPPGPLPWRCTHPCRFHATSTDEQATKVLRGITMAELPKGDIRKHFRGQPLLALDDCGDHTVRIIPSTLLQDDTLPTSMRGSNRNIYPGPEDPLRWQYQTARPVTRSIGGGADLTLSVIASW